MCINDVGRGTPRQALGVPPSGGITVEVERLRAHAGPPKGGTPSAFSLWAKLLVVELLIDAIIRHHLCDVVLGLAKDQLRNVALRLI